MSPEIRAIVPIDGRKYPFVSDDPYIEAVRDGREPELAEMVPLFKALVRPTDTVLDVGANIGCTTVLFGSLAQSVHAFEPSPVTFGFLSRNVAASGLANIRSHNFALGAAEGRTTLTYAPGNRAGAFVSDRLTASQGHCVEPIEVRPLDAIAPALGIDAVDFMKIDVEGFEKSVIEGAAKTLGRHRPLVLVELNHWCLNAFQRISIPDFFDFLRATFPIVRAVDGRSYLDLYDPDDAYRVMYYHIVHLRFLNLVVGYDAARFAPFDRAFTRGFAG